MRLQVEKGMLWAENLLVSSSVRKSFFIAVCPDSIASVIRQQSPKSPGGAHPQIKCACLLENAGVAS